MSERNTGRAADLLDWKSLPHEKKVQYLPEKMWRQEGFVPKADAESQGFLINGKVVVMYHAGDVERAAQQERSEE